MPYSRQRHRAYGTGHQRVRVALLGRLRDGVDLCPLCQEPMARWQLLDLHHTDPAAKAAGLPGDALAHRDCNHRDGSRRGAATTHEKIRQALRPVPPPPVSGRVW